MADSIDDGLGLDKTKVVVVEHDERWQERFDRLSAQLTSALVALAPQVQVAHVGSTSVPGLAAKPVLDVAVGLVADIDTDDLVASLEPIGLSYQGDLGNYGGRLFTSEPSVGVSVANVHVVRQDNFQWSCYLLFRDELRANEALRNEYGALKTSLAVEFADDRAGYNEAKFGFVFSVVAELAASAGVEGVPSDAEPAD